MQEQQLQRDVVHLSRNVWFKYFFDRTFLTHYICKLWPWGSKTQLKYLKFIHRKHFLLGYCLLIDQFWLFVLSYICISSVNLPGYLNYFKLYLHWYKSIILYVVRNGLTVNGHGQVGILGPWSTWLYAKLLTPANISGFKITLKKLVWRKGMRQSNFFMRKTKKL